MSDRKFQLGSDEHVIIHLPSMKPGKNDVFSGNAKWRIRSLQGSRQVEFSRADMRRFFAAVSAVHEQLKGCFSLQFAESLFRLSGEVAPRGYIRISLSANDSPFQHSRENLSWECSGTFSCYAEDLVKVLKTEEHFL